MAAVIYLGRNVKVEVGKTFSAPISITALTQANPGVATATAHGLANGAHGIISAAGMVQLDGQLIRVASVAANTFQLEGIDTSAYTAFTSGTITPVSAWDTIGNARGLTADQQQTNKIDITTLLDTEKQEIFDIPNAVTFSVDAFFDPASAANVTILKASRANAQIPVRVTFSGNQKYIFNAYVSGGDAFSMDIGQPATTQYQFTAIRNRLFFAS